MSRMTWVSASFLRFRNYILVLEWRNFHVNISYTQAWGWLHQALSFCRRMKGLSPIIHALKEKWSQNVQARKSGVILQIRKPKFRVDEGPGTAGLEQIPSDNQFSSHLSMLLLQAPLPPWSLGRPCTVVTLCFCCWTRDGFVWYIFLFFMTLTQKRLELEGTQ